MCTFQSGVEEQIVKEKTGHHSDAEEAVISSKVSKLSRGWFDIDSGFKGTQHITMVGSPQISTCEKLCKILSCVDPTPPKVKSVKFGVEFHDNHN